MPTLISAGCSFIWGNELPDCTPQRPSLQTWPALLAQHKHMDYLCVAKPGSGNDSIARRTIAAINKTPNVGMVAVLWSWSYRLELQVRSQLQTDYYKLHEAIELPGQMDGAGWLNICMHNTASAAEKSKFFKSDRWHTEKLQKQYDFLESTGLNDYTRNIFLLTDRSYLYYRSLQSALYLQLFLESKNIPYVFSCASDEFLIAKNDAEPLTDLINWDKFVCLDGFLNWVNGNNQDLCPQGHPAASAHAAWFQYHDKYM
jgi:hypothetical protein